MGITNKGGRWIYVKRVPRRFQHVDARTFARIALNTDSQSEAERKAPAVEAELFAYWEALAAGRAADAVARYDAAKALAEARGFHYLPVADLAAGPLDVILERLERIGAAREIGSAEVVAAELGGVAPPPVKLSEALAEFFDLTTDRLRGKSEAQKHRWRLPRKRSIAYFCEVVGDKSLDRITRDDALEFRRWWRDRIEGEGLNPNSANKNFGHLSDLVRTWSGLKKVKIDNPFTGLRFSEKGQTEKFPFSVAFIRDRLLGAGALDGLNAEARDVLLVMVNTGARPSEITNGGAELLQVGAEVPHLRIRSGVATLKTGQSRREIPLLGVSLAAARRLAGAGGCTRYRDNSDSWSAAVNKFLRENGLRETPNHTAYSLRHSFEDRLLEARVDERLRVEMMGHKYKRPEYGHGGSLELKREALALIAL